MENQNKETKETKETQAKIKKSEATSSSIDNIGHSRVYLLEKESLDVRDLLGSNKDAKAELVNQINDYIFSTDPEHENPLKEIRGYYTKMHENLDAKVQTLVR